MAIGSFAPIFVRDNVQQPWLPCVIMRQAEKECIIFDSDGVKQVGVFPTVFNDDGSPVDDEVTSGWGMTLAGTLVVCTFHYCIQVNVGHMWFPHSGYYVDSCIESKSDASAASSFLNLCTQSSPFNPVI
eukprot:489715-Pleurochrysis_carterae.AAC.1